jgi:uncharacterized membrane protein
MHAEPDAPIRSEPIDVAALAVTAILTALVAAGVRSPVRAVLALAFVAFVPGWAIVTNRTPIARSSRIALAVVLSLAVSAAAATITLWLHVWEPDVLFYVAAAASAAAIGYKLARGRQTSA